MRIVLAVSIVIASISSASAQFAMDHGHAADAVKAAYDRQAAADARASAIRSGTPLLPSQNTDFAVGGRTTIQVVRRTEEELKADQLAEAEWSARCKPSVEEDGDGIRRTRYAAKDCDLDRFNTAGN
ncbi:hypothetical protein [Afipia sp. GAS231]|uniref:hypothetical protein n=1 Tax=Afipia sp. GAS231 TaxID=1882747 RepID=UPI00087A5BDC|nr:hypothetical protein [Afipia sp. GAS231]SDP12541.1 hypothetical protein SAMN05444050_5905 [Afipia sp. GAS231]